MSDTQVSTEDLAGQLLTDMRALGADVLEIAPGWRSTDAIAIRQRFASWPLPDPFSPRAGRDLAALRDVLVAEIDHETDGVVWDISRSDHGLDLELAFIPRPNRTERGEAIAALLARAEAVILSRDRIMDRVSAAKAVLRQFQKED